MLHSARKWHINWGVLSLPFRAEYWCEVWRFGNHLRTMRQQAGDEAYALKMASRKLERALFPVPSENCLFPDFLRQTPYVFKPLELDFSVNYCWMWSWLKKGRKSATKLVQSFISDLNGGRRGGDWAERRDWRCECGECVCSVKSQMGWGLCGWNLLQVPQKAIHSLKVLGSSIRTPGKHGVGGRLWKWAKGAERGCAGSQRLTSWFPFITKKNTGSIYTF